MLRDTVAPAASGVFHNFPDIAKGILTVLLPSLDREADETTLKEILGAFSRLPAHSDVKPALEKVRHSVCQAVLLTNGSRANTEKLAHDNGIERLIDDISRWPIATYLPNFFQFCIKEPLTNPARAATYINHHRYM
ncbi:MAG: hypothetical protein RQ826_05770 [Xanthomonadales bacterium]|nr:hypothetical protein [Xanthomonadales bacterium]